MALRSRGRAGSTQGRTDAKDFDTTTYLPLPQAKEERSRKASRVQAPSR